MRTSARIASADATANTPGPLTSSRAEPGSARAKAVSTASSALRPASTSSALAGDVATSRARSAPAANQTPWRSSTRLSPRQTSSSSSQAPIGSAKPNCLTSGAAELLSCYQELLKLLVQPVDPKRLGGCRGREQVAVAEQEIPIGVGEVLRLVADEAEQPGSPAGRRRPSG